MFGRRITLFKLFGFEVRLDASWIVIALLVTWSLATAVFPSTQAGLPRSAYWWMGIAGALGFFASIVIHEFCHSVVARHYRLPMKGITLFIFGGVAEMSEEPRSPKVEFLMAVAGPAASIVIGFLFYLVQLTGVGGHVEAAAIVAYLAWINLILAAFNLIPAFPLDGGRIMRAALWYWQGDLARATEIASRIGSGFGFLLMAFAILQLFNGYLVSAIWYFLIGSFLRGASQASYDQLVLQSALAGEPIRRLMRPDPVTVRPDISLRQLVEDYIYRYGFSEYPVVSESQNLIGCVSAKDVKSIPKEEWDWHRVAEVIEPCSGANTVSPDTDALEALSKIRETGASGLLVTERNHFLSFVSLKDLMNFLAAKTELEGGSRLLAAPRL